MDIVQKFYDNLATEYHKLFLDWESNGLEQAKILDDIFKAYGVDKNCEILDCACGIGTQAIGLATLGYKVTGSDLSEGGLNQAKAIAKKRNLNIPFKKADFRCLDISFLVEFDVVIAMDNALPHMLNKGDMERAINSISSKIKKGGLFVASIRDYDELLKTKPPYSPPYIHQTENGKRVSFQLWDWNDDCYKLVQFIIEDEAQLKVSKFECEYRAVQRDEITNLLKKQGMQVWWKFPDDTGFYQPIVIAKK